MNAQIIFLLGVAAAFALLPAASAHAQQRELKPGLNYTSIYNKPVKRPEPPEKPSVEKPASPENAPETITEESAESRIWNKYKALATGTAGQAETSEEPELPKEETEKTASRSATPASIKIEGPKSTVAELISRWQEQKEQQKDMRSKSFQVPEHLKNGIKTEKPQQQNTSTTNSGSLQHRSYR